MLFLVEATRVVSTRALTKTNGNRASYKMDHTTCGVRRNIYKGTILYTFETIIVLVQVRLREKYILCTPSLALPGFEPITLKSWTVHFMSLRRSSLPQLKSTVENNLDTMTCLLFN